MSPDHGQVYQPAEDSWLLLRAAEREIRPDDRVLEVGVGSGFVSARLSGCRLVAGTDINPHAVRSARCRGVDVIRTDLTAGIRERSCDLILFNPPYLPTEPGERIDDWLEYALDGGVTGCDVIERFLREVSPVLSEKGRVLLLVSSLNNLDSIRDLVRINGWEGEIIDQEEVEDGETLFIFRLIPVF